MKREAPGAKGEEMTLLLQCKNLCVVYYDKLRNAASLKKCSGVKKKE